MMSMIRKKFALFAIFALLFAIFLTVGFYSVEAVEANREGSGELERLFDLRRSIVEKQVDLGLYSSETGKAHMETIDYHQEKGLVQIMPQYLPKTWFSWPEWPRVEDKISSLESYRDALEVMDLEDEEQIIRVREEGVTEHLQSRGLSDKEVITELYEKRRDNVKKRTDMEWFTPKQKEMYLEMLDFHEERNQIRIIPFYAPRAWLTWNGWPNLDDKISSLESYLQALEIKYEARQEIP